ncbi:MAG: hypothetical protein WBV73_01850 [Phormidium sp.]
MIQLPVVKVSEFVNTQTIIHFAPTDFGIDFSAENQPQVRKTGPST